MPFPTRSGSRAGTAGRECPAKNAETMISAVYYIFLVLLCTFFMILSALALVVCYPFDKGRRVVHELSRILVRTFFAIPPRWRQRVEGLEHVDRKKSYVIVLNHNTVIDIPTLYYIPLNFQLQPAGSDLFFCSIDKFRCHIVLLFQNNPQSFSIIFPEKG